MAPGPNGSPPGVPAVPNPCRGLGRSEWGVRASAVQEAVGRAAGVGYVQQRPEPGIASGKGGHRLRSGGLLVPGEVEGPAGWIDPGEHHALAARGGPHLRPEMTRLLLSRARSEVGRTRADGQPPLSHPVWEPLSGWRELRSPLADCGQRQSANLGQLTLCTWSCCTTLPGAIRLGCMLGKHHVTLTCALTSIRQDTKRAGPLSDSECACFRNWSLISIPSRPGKRSSWRAPWRRPSAERASRGWRAVTECRARPGMLALADPGASSACLPWCRLHGPRRKAAGPYRAAYILKRAGNLLARTRRPGVSTCAPFSHATRPFTITRSNPSDFANGSK